MAARTFRRCSQTLAGVAWVIATFGGAIALFAGMGFRHRAPDRRFRRRRPGSDKGADKGKRANPVTPSSWRR
ncbi:MAG: hypothetical protein R3D01_06780 [Hyphomicrobiales bacterium]